MRNQQEIQGINTWPFEVDQINLSRVYSPVFDTKSSFACRISLIVILDEEIIFQNQELFERSPKEYPLHLLW